MLEDAWRPDRMVVVMGLGNDDDGGDDGDNDHHAGAMVA